MIKLLTPSDAVAYRELRLKSLQEAPFAFSEGYEDEVQKDLEAFAKDLKIKGNPPERFILGARDAQGELIGFVTFKRDQRSKARHKGMIHAMYTAPAFRKQGIGKQLIMELFERVKLLEGLEQIHLWVLHTTTSATDFYLKCGFESQGAFVKNDLKFEGQYIHAAYMVKYL